MRTIASIRQDIINRAYELIHMTGGDTAGRGGTCTLEELYANVIHFAKKFDNTRLPKPYIAGIRKAELQDFEDYLDKFTETFSYHGLIPTKKFTFNYDALLLKHASSKNESIDNTVDIKDSETGKESQKDEGENISGEGGNITAQTENFGITDSSGFDDKLSDSRDAQSTESQEESINETIISSGIENNRGTTCRHDRACSPIQFEPIQTSPTSAIGPTSKNPEVTLPSSSNPSRDIQKENPTEPPSRSSAAPQPKTSGLLNISNQVIHNGINSIPQRLKIF